MIHELQSGVRRDDGDRAPFGTERCTPSTTWRIAAKFTFITRRGVSAGARRSRRRGRSAREGCQASSMAALVPEVALVKRELVVGFAVVDTKHLAAEALHDLGGGGTHARVATDDQRALPLVPERVGPCLPSWSGAGATDDRRERTVVSHFRGMYLVRQRRRRGLRVVAHRRCVAVRAAARRRSWSRGSARSPRSRSGARCRWSCSRRTAVGAVPDAAVDGDRPGADPAGDAVRAVRGPECTPPDSP